jgi:glycosyltransferase involved in cell wall biosynthesis
LPTILHLTYDYVRRGKTYAVSELIKATEKISTPKIISLYRVTRKIRESTEVDPSGIIHLKSFGLPYGLFHIRNLRKVYKTINDRHTAKMLDLNKVDVIHGHKLTYEGYIGYLLALRMDLPLFISLRQTDFYVLKYRPDLSSKMKNILNYASSIFYIMPFMLNRLKRCFGETFYKNNIEKKLVFLPNIILKEPSALKTATPKKYFFTALRMDRESVKRKNLDNLFRALKSNADLDYDLYLAGDGECFDLLKSWVEKYKISHRVKFLGKVPYHDIDHYFAEAAAFVMPSFSETFGMVYAEALINGTPILYSRGTGFDGLFENVGEAVDPRSVESIKNGLIRIIEKNQFYRDNISRLQDENSFHIFSKDYATKKYLKALNNLY